MYPNSFYKATITLIPKSYKDIKTPKNYRPISLMNTDTNVLLKSTEKLFKNIPKSHPRRLSGLHLRDAENV